MSNWPDRQQAERILNEWIKDENLKKHAYAVEAAMKAYAERFGEDPERWGIAGLLHDIDYEKYPDLKDHPFRGAQYLKECGFSNELVDAILAHAEHTGIIRDTNLKKALFAVDELTGLIVAATLVIPSRKIKDLKAESVLKRFKEKAFARKVNREQILKGVEELGVTLNEHVEIVLSAMKSISERLGL